MEKSGRILAANAAGRALRETEPERVQERLMSALDSATPTDGVQLRRLDALDDCEDCYLALFSAPEKTLETRLATCRERWGLSERQTQVLGLLVDGACNKDIAVALDCAVNTVENHLGALLHRSQSESRAQLISRFWKES